MKETSADSKNKSIEKLGSLIKEVKVAMLTTTTGEGALHSCPMMTQEVDFNGELWFFTQKNTSKVEHIQRDSNVNVVYSKPDDQLYISVSGQAELVEDRAKIDELWKPALKAWFEGGKDDPQLALIRVDVEGAEYWDSPSSPVAYLAGFAKSILTGKGPKAVGDHAKLNIQ